MRILIENAGAQRGILILEQSGRLVIQAEAMADKNSLKLMQEVPVEKF